MIGISFRLREHIFVNKDFDFSANLIIRIYTGEYVGE